MFLNMNCLFVNSHVFIFFNASNFSRMAPEAVRRRLLPEATASDEPDINNLTEDDRNAIDEVLSRNKSNFNGHTIFWMIAAALVFNYTDFANVLVNDSRIKTDLLKVGSGMIAVNLSVGAYLVVYMSYIRGKKDWSAHAHPALIPVATLFGCIGMVISTIALWPVWGFLTLPILFTLFMGIVMLASLMPF